MDHRLQRERRLAMCACVCAEREAADIEARIATDDVWVVAGAPLSVEANAPRRCNDSDHAPRSPGQYHSMSDESAAIFGCWIHFS